jgi:GPH family glycoside/pentoside/hexuronide:cation symporter
MADVCDLDELQTGERREGMFGSIYWWMVKLGMSLAFLLSGYLLNATGYNVEMGGAQTSFTFFWMRVVDVAIPATTSLLAIIAVAKFGISEERAYEIRELLKIRRAEKKKKPATE